MVRVCNDAISCSFCHPSNANLAVAFIGLHCKGEQAINVLLLLHYKIMSRQDSTVRFWNFFREETHEQAEEEEGEDLVSKAETEFFKIVEAEKKALEEAENKRNAALAEVKQAISQEGVTHEEYKDEETEEKKSDEV